MKKLQEANNASKLFPDIVKLIDESRNYVAQTVNSTLTLLYWKIGQRINQDILLNQRATYGKQIVVSLARQLEAAYGSSLAEKNLRRMMQFADVFPDEQIELLQLDKAGIKIAEYLTELPDKKLLQQKLHQAIEISKKQIENHE